MNTEQYIITLRPKTRGFHLVTDELLSLLPQLQRFRTGLAHFFILHTSASLSINENADPTVRADMERWFSETVRENEAYYTHKSEGPDDMPAHLKASLLGASVTAPVREGRLLLGVWQGVYLCEHRDNGGARRIAVTILGETRNESRS
jgi:secondary thiamine-phosphate synthase enzyme